MITKLDHQTDKKLFVSILVHESSYQDIHENFNNKKEEKIMDGIKLFQVTEEDL